MPTYVLYRGGVTVSFARYKTRRLVLNCHHRPFSSYVVTPAELGSALSRNPSSKIATLARTIPVCAAWFLPNDPERRTGLSVFEKNRIPGARFFDLDAFKDHESPYPHMLPSPTGFATAMEELGIQRDDEVVVYDSAELGIFSAPRVAWTMKVFGHDRVHLLNNFKLWIDGGYPVESGEPGSVQRSYYPVPDFDASKVVAFEQVRQLALGRGKEGADRVQILDARPKGRWTGEDPEPRPGLSSGHIPGSLSVPVSDLLDPVTKALLPRDQLRRVFDANGVDPTKHIITSCGTGVTAAVIDAALSEVGYKGQQLYDGSWTEWAQRVDEAEGLIEKTS
ncbi:MAG: hypothetical protein M1832_000761 [Thelocarpon impressellum]|nr:MAG: hypothetical protein M1832_000761 [Thelocarpon impressellum]